ncbi:hypothetical protein VTL71DRAFT_4277 [Oculimacula yallundae]|uniref:Feruloyl esterase C n=1 Tax=Oculimacula yallundae TaxID=86028 RepID=A0ABR4C6I5_9HELO
MALLNIFLLKALLLSSLATLALGAPAYNQSTSPLDARASLPANGAKSGGCGKAATITSGTKSVTVNGKQRQYIIRVPDNYNQNTPYRLIFGFHWRGGSMQDVATGLTDQPNIWNHYGLQKLAGETAIFVSPGGLDKGWANNNGEDMAFVDKMLSDITAGLCVNPALIFSNGFSYGAAMSYSIACSRATKFRAVAAIAGGEVSGCAGGNDPIAYLGMHGVQDGIFPIPRGQLLRDRFVKNNGCTKQNPPEPVKGSVTHKKTTYANCKAGRPVVWIASDSGHISAPADGTSGEDKRTTWAPGETWSFFTQFS